MSDNRNVIDVKVDEIDMDVTEKEIKTDEQQIHGQEQTNIQVDNRFEQSTSKNDLNSSQQTPYGKHSVFFQGYEMKDGKIKSMFSKGYCKVTKKNETDYMVYNGDKKHYLSSANEFKEWKEQNLKQSLTDCLTGRSNHLLVQNNNDEENDGGKKKKSMKHVKDILIEKRKKKQDKLRRNRVIDNSLINIPEYDVDRNVFPIIRINRHDDLLNQFLNSNQRILRSLRNNNNNCELVPHLSYGFQQPTHHNCRYHHCRHSHCMPNGMFDQPNYFQRIQKRQYESYFDSPTEFEMNFPFGRFW